MDTYGDQTPTIGRYGSCTVLKLCTVFIPPDTQGSGHVDESQLRKMVLAGKKTERVVFAASEEMKAALETIAEEKCVSLSALMTSLAAEEILANKELFEEVKH